jgi:hypothetical protein
MKWMAATYSHESPPRAANGAVFQDGLDEIIAARRLETALPADEWAQRPLITSRRAN